MAAWTPTQPAPAEPAAAAPQDPPPAPDHAAAVATLCAAARRDDLVAVLLPLANASGLDAVRRVLAVAPAASGIDNKTPSGEAPPANRAGATSRDIYASRLQLALGARTL